MPVAQVIRFDERQSVARPQRRPERAQGAVLRFPARSGAELALLMIAADADGIAGRGRDPG